jgi:hypothetical protein
MHSSRHGFQSKIATAALVLMPVTIWLLLRGYHGLLGDAQLYAFQALARIHPLLSIDLYLQNTSQDQFTIFSPIYAWFIETLGLEHAARLLTLVFTIWLLAAAWSSARALTRRDGAWFAVIALLIIDGSYGGSGVFKFAEQFLTARLPAEALIVTSIACYLRGQKLVAVAMAAATLLVHPLIALPGLLFLVCLSVPSRASIIGGIGCAMAGAIVSGVAIRFPGGSHLFPVMDLPWLHVVQERSQFLFLQLWSFRDWELNARPFFYLTFTALAIPDDRIRKLCEAAAVVGAAGLAVSLFASALGPVAILVQGQAWRWVWIATFVSILLLPATILQIWPDKSCGWLCAVLLISGLTLPVDGTACASLAMILWLMRSDIAVRAGVSFRRTFFVLGAAAVGLTLVQSWEFVSSAIHQSGTGAAQTRNMIALKVLAALAAVLIWWHLRRSKNVWTTTLVSVALLALSIFILPAAFKQSRMLAYAPDIDEFADWESAIPPSSAVLVTPARDVGTFVWFTLQRPNYLTVDQSAGVVFSRATALEVQRRSQVLLPVMDPNWKLMTHLRTAPDRLTIDAATRPLNADSLKQICADPPLGFVISPQEVGFDALAHSRSGSWKGWNLYDCRNVRSRAGT